MGDGREGRFSRDPLPVFSAGGRCKQFWYGQGCPLFDVVQTAFPLPTRRRPPSKVSRRMVLERLSWRVPCPNHASFRLSTVARGGSILWTHKDVDLAPNLVVDLVLPVGARCGEVSSGTRFRKPGSFFRVNKQGPYFTAIEEDGGDKRFVRLEFAWEAESVA